VDIEAGVGGTGCPFVGEARRKMIRKGKSRIDEPIAIAFEESQRSGSSQRTGSRLTSSQWHPGSCSHRLSQQFSCNLVRLHIPGERAPGGTFHPAMGRRSPVPLAIMQMKQP
jgi:hypothetical protein